MFQSTLKSPNIVYGVTGTPTSYEKCVFAAHLASNGCFISPGRPDSNRLKCELKTSISKETYFGNPARDFTRNKTIHKKLGKAAYKGLQDTWPLLWASCDSLWHPCGNLEGYWRDPCQELAGSVRSPCEMLAGSLWGLCGVHL